MAAAQLLPAALDSGERLAEHDLEVGELRVDVVVDVVAHPGRFVLRLDDDALGLAGRFLGDLGPRDEPGALPLGLVDDALRLDPTLGHQILTALQQFFCLGELAGQHLAQLLEQGEQLGAVDDAGRRHRHRPRALDRGDDLVKLVVGGHRSRSTSRRLTVSGTSAETSPPYVATSLTRLDDR